MSRTRDSQGRRLVVIDVGNTNTVVGLFKGGKLVDHFRLSTESERTEDEYSSLMLPLLNRVGLDPSAAVPQIYVFQNSAIDKSRIGAERINRLLANWTGAVIRETLTEHDVPLSLVQGVQISNADVADKVGKQAVAWSMTRS